MSKTKTVLLAEATKAEMQQFAVDHLGLPESPPNILPETLRAKIAAAWDKGEITIVVQDEAPAETPEAAPTANDDEFVNIIIDKTEEAGGNDPVWVCVNGRGLWIPRGEPVRIHKRYLHVLENAVRTVYDQVPAADGKPGQLKPREVNAYPFRLAA